MEFADFIKKASKFFKKNEIKNLVKAYEFAKTAHGDQKRADGSPYITHPIAVADIILSFFPDVVMLQSALLHDVLEDTEVTYEQLFSKFGQQVADIVNGVTKISTFNFSSYEETQAENFRKILLAMSRDIRVIILKIADRLHNMRTLEYLPPHKQKNIARTTLEIYAPLAHRLGMGKIKDELEDLSFRFLYPDKYYELVEKVNQRRTSHEEYLKKVISILSQKLKENKIKARVEGRAKHLYSIFLKMQRDKKHFEEIYDIAGVRIITTNIKDCYGAMGIVHALWPPVPGRIKDYIATPKSNMYQSIHTTVIGPDGEFVEIQIRTEEMHRIAEEGIAAHWAYKERIEHKKIEKRFLWLRNILDWQESYKDPREFMEALKIDLFPESVFVFTPRGDVKELPLGSTPIDFAYAIHTEVGNSCVGAKVNGKIVPLNYKLKTGDVVEIITLKGHEPSIDWLKIVRTPRAMNRIRQFIKQKQNKENIIIGRNILESKLKSQNINLVNVEKGEYFKKILDAYNFHEPDELYFAIGAAKISVNSVIKQILRYEKPQVKGEIELKKEPLKDVERGGVFLEGLDNVEIHFAKCCHPIPGDNIIGYITRGRGVTIHKDNCRNLKFLLQEKDRIIPARWNLKAQSRFIVTLIIKSYDRAGLLADIAGILKDTGINILKADVVTNPGHSATVSLRIEVKDTEQLERAIAKLESLHEITEIKRV